MLVSLLLASLIAQASAHYTFPFLLIDDTASEAWVNVRQSNNHQDLGPVTDVTSPDMTCYNTITQSTATTVTVPAGSNVGFRSHSEDGLYHKGVVNIYMARAPGDVNDFDGDGEVWFKVHEVAPVTDGGSTIVFPSERETDFSFPLPEALPSGQYLLRMEAIALQEAATFGAAQFYIACAQIEVTGGGTGTPGPLVSIPGVYDGNEPGILIDIYWPVPATYTMPGPPVWTGN